MAKLDCKPHLSPNLRSNSKIWFCCHPDDFEEYFDKITDDLLKKRDLKIQDIAVWYDREPRAEFDQEKFLSDLSQIKLFIVAVTEKFLSEDSRAKLLELKYASEKKIPILPLMLENGLDRQFHEVFGSVQYLDPFVKEGTAIGYGDKLNAFLSSIFVDQNLQERIENEFDATIFLSYRKIDRAYAQELMELIHRNDKFRDIAIWYDEFLTPGENYNNSISDAIKDSHVFVMAVTPNILAKSYDKDGGICENYVVSTEYPLAYELGKPIVACEMVHTGMQIHRKFDHLPYYIPEGRVDMLYSDLEHKLSGISLGAKRKSPEHDFLIGMAYFTGTCVERNKEKGIQIITAAAEQGNIEAMDRLSTIYGTGDGVVKDDVQKVKWATKISDHYEEMLNNADHISCRLTEFYLDSYIKSLLLTNLSLILNEQPLLLEVNIAKYKKVYEKVKDITPKSADILWAIYSSYKHYGAFGQNKKEKLRFNFRALETAEKLLAEDESITNVYAVSESLLHLARTFHKDSDYQKAEEYSLRALDYAEKLISMKGNIRSDIFVNKSVLSSIQYAAQLHIDCCLCYAKINLALGNFDKAASFLLRDLARSVHLSILFKNNEILKNNIEASSALISYYLSQGNADEAKKYYEKTLLSLDTLKDDSNSLRIYLTYAFARLGAYEESVKNYSIAENYYLNALKHNDFSLETISNRNMALNILILKRLSDVYKKSGSAALAENYLNQSKLISDNYNQLPHEGTLSSKLSALNAEIFCITENDESLTQITSEKRGETSEISPLYQSAQGHIKSGNILLSVGNTNGAKQHFSKSIEILRSLANSFPNENLYSSTLADAEEKLRSADVPSPAPEPKKKSRSLLSIFKKK